MSKALKLLAVLVLALGSAVIAPPAARAANSLEWTDQEIIEAGIAPENLDSFKQYLEDEAYFESDDYVPSFPSSRSVSDSPAPDSRVAIISFWHTNRVFPNPRQKVDCNATQLDERFFITAKGCIRGNRNVLGYVWRQGNHYAGIEQVYFIGDDNYDVALVRVGAGMKNNSYFRIADHGIATNYSGYYVTGYGSETELRRNPTWARFTAFGERNPATVNGMTSIYWLNGHNKRNALCLKNERGAALRDGDDIFGVYSMNISPPGKVWNTCSDAIGVTEVSERKTDIENVLRTNRKSTLGEKVRAFNGIVWMKAHYPRG